MFSSNAFTVWTSCLDKIKLLQLAKTFTCAVKANLHISKEISGYTASHSLTIGKQFIERERECQEYPVI